MADTPLLGLNIDPDASISLFEQVYEALRKRVVSGQLVAGDRLPPTRKLAEELGVSRTTIITAYDQLIAEGFAQGRAGSGVYISEIGEVEQVTAVDSSATGNPQPTSTPVEPQPFLPGQPDARLFPCRQWATAAATKNGILCSALSSYYTSAAPRNGLLMGFCGYTVDEMAAAMVRLKDVIYSVPR
ncbi:MAG: GntR family transcriptional regulator [Gammaproteobacteria bacterium]|nr:GntR family transcriptional regulator [Gammaproteobacteria bacterium]